MNKLREKLLEAVKNDGPMELEQITDDFSVKFAMWLIKATEEKTYIELQQYFKTQYYGKE